MEQSKKKPSKEGLVLLLLGVVALAGLLYMAYSGAGSSDPDRSGVPTTQREADGGG